MKLSEAIRIGAKIRPQAYGAYYLVGQMTGRIGSCAIGAAYEAAGFYQPEKLAMPCTLEDRAHWFEGLDKWKEKGQTFTCPECLAEQREEPIPLLVTHLNDFHAWSRENIADHIERLGY